MHETFYLCSWKHFENINVIMDALLEHKWEAVNHRLEERFGKSPDIEAILFLIGVQELNTAQYSFTKEQKEDLMHIAMCTLLSDSGYYEPDYKDEDGWPHFKEVKTPPAMKVAEQEDFLKEHIIRYFEKTGLIDIDSATN